MRELIASYRRADFRIEWYSGSGAGGQHRNKHQNCCRIIHVASGLTARGTESRSRAANQRAAFERLARMLVQRCHTAPAAARGDDATVVRTYHIVDSRVVDHGSGLTCRPGDVVDHLEAFRVHADRQPRPQSGRGRP